MIFNLKCLETYIDVFDGKKIVYVAVDSVGRYSNEKIVEALPILKRFDEIHLFENHPIHRESESLIRLLSHVKDSTDSISFYGHSKGSTHPIDNTLRNWILCMYYFNLDGDYLKEAEQQLSTNYTTSGILKKDCKTDGIIGDWHYSGAFFWINDEKFFLPTNIGNNVIIGSNATILPVNICSDAVIGAGSVVTKDIDVKGTYVGNPARLLRKF